MKQKKNSDNRIVNASDIKKLTSKQEIFYLIRNKYGIPPNWQRPEGFISLCRIILEQQVSLESGAAHFKKLNNYLPRFSPAEILKLNDREMKQCQISRQKASYLRALSQSILDKKLELNKLSLVSQEEARKILTGIKGIGSWTTDIYLMFCLQSKDIFPLGDIALITSIKELTRVRSKEGILRFTNKLKPYRSLAAYFLWFYYLKKRNRL